MHGALRVAVVVVGLAASATGLGAGSPGTAAQGAVLAELFTSEGCSSCPPADALIEQLDATSSSGSVEVIALEEHVDYWDHLGWRDPFSSPLFTRRQSDYEARVFRTGDIFTPQLVVDGRAQCIGSDRRAVQHEIDAAARQPRASIRIEVGNDDAGRVPVTVAVDVPQALQKHRSAEIIVLVAERGLTTDVRRGENRGRTLAHGAVVRAFTRAGTIGPNALSSTATGTVVIPPAWNRSNLRIVAFVQEPDTMRVLGAAATPIR